MPDEPVAVPMEGERFPILRGGSIPWSVAEEAYIVYAQRYGTSQSLRCLAARGGFDVEELDDFLPGWRDKSSEITQLRADLTRERAAREKAERERDESDGIAAAAAERADDLYGMLEEERAAARVATRILQQRLSDVERTFDNARICLIGMCAHTSEVECARVLEEALVTLSGTKESG